MKRLPPWVEGIGVVSAAILAMQVVWSCVAWLVTPSDETMAKLLLPVARLDLYWAMCGSIAVSCVSAWYWDWLKGNRTQAQIDRQIAEAIEQALANAGQAKHDEMDHQNADDDRRTKVDGSLGES
ncbi:MAG: hypothetical protein ACRCT8_06145 [Lacipirellulaceae bacterium]